jgi:hypothetical protein
MTGNSLISPQATARFVVTLPPGPSRLAAALRKDVAAAFTALTSTDDAFRHLALRAKGRLVIMIPYVDYIGAAWAVDLFELSGATERILIVREVRQLDDCGAAGEKLKRAVTRVLDYGGSGGVTGSDETFHAKIVLADGVAAYVGSANLLRRSKESNLECGMLIEGPAVQSIKVVVDAVLATFESH